MVFRCLSTLILFFCSVALSAQDRCSIEEYNQVRKKRGLINESTKEFEDWINRKIAQQKLRSFSTQETADITYTIPVVFHIIHKGEAVGSGVNISDAQIASQVKVLNEDYQRLNADASSTPTEFQPLAGSLSIQFVLAKQDPGGNATNGIVRVRGSQNVWAISDDAALKSQSYWPAEDYLNIWVCDMGSGLVGYAQFPQSTSLQGLEDAPNERLTDGVTLDYITVGSINDGDFLLDSRYNRGRTATHEVGHFLGLRHIWGDDSGACTGTDYVADTPNQGNSTTGCPGHPRTSCSVTSMFQNYLDYTNDACMNLFTRGQIDRMIAILSNSPRRASLLTSPGARAPQGNGLIVDLGITGYSSPSPVTCQKNNSPVISIKNKGTASIFSFKVTTTLNGTTSQTQTINVNSFEPGAERSFVLNPILLNDGLNEIRFEISEPNGTLDQGVTDNSSSIKTAVNSSKDILPLRQNWENSFQSLWTIVSQGQTESWKSTSTNFNRSLQYVGFNNSTIGAESWIATPILNLNNTQKASIFFDVSYGKRDNANENLKILVSKDCGVTYNNLPIYSRSGTELSTATSNTSWLPSAAAQWRREYVNLSDYAGEQNVRLAFVVTNGNGNNVYLDNLEFFVDDNPNPVQTEDRYTLYTGPADFKVTFNLANRQDVRMQIYNLQGQVVIDNLIYQVLNQTYDVDFSPTSSGIYLVRMQIGQELSTRKIFVAR